MIIPVFTPHGGCPERCSFCDQSVSGGTPLSANAVSKTIGTYLRQASGQAAQEVAFYGGTFTAMPKPRQLAYLEAVRPFLSSGQVEAVRISTRPDAIEREWMGYLSREFLVKTVELGVQSFNPSVLKALGRSHSVESVACAVAELQGLGLKVGVHLLLGCPNENGEDDALTLQWLERLLPDYLRLHPLLVLRGTALEQLWQIGDFHPLTLECAVERVAGLVEHAEALGIRVIRLGLQQNELLEQAVVAGPHHPAFGDLVRGRLARNRLERRLSLLLGRSKSPAALELLVSPRLSGTLPGPGGSNMKWIQDRFSLSQVRLRVVQDRHPYDDEPEIRLYHAPGPA